MGGELAPHRKQEGWQYLRFPNNIFEVHKKEWARSKPRWVYYIVCGMTHRLIYDDGADGSRIISSVRVERAVETDDYLKRCAEEGLLAVAVPLPAGIRWDVLAPRDAPSFTGEGGRRCWPTLREAYWRYKGRSKHEASVPD